MHVTAASKKFKVASSDFYGERRAPASCTDDRQPNCIVLSAVRRREGWVGERNSVGYTRSMENLIPAPNGFVFGVGVPNISHGVGLIVSIFYLLLK